MQPSSLRRVWVTRAQPGADATARRLRTLGYDPLVAPVLEVRALEPAALELEGVAALAFTSANGVRALAQITAERRLPVFAVGDATAQAATAAGFSDVRSADGDVGDLAALIAEGRAGLAGVVLHASGRETTGDLAADLSARGVNATAAVLYETVAVEAWPSGVEAALPTLHAVLVHSPKAGRTLARLVTDARQETIASLAAIGLSPACLAPLQGLGLGLVVAASQPREDAMLALLDP